MSYKNGDAVTIEFCTQHPSTGAATNGDSLPAGTFARNGTDDGAVTVTVTNVDTGRYKAAFTIPAGAAAGDTCTLSIAATVNAIAGKGIVWQAVIDTKRAADLATTLGAAGAGLTALGDTRIANLDVAVSTRSTLGGTAQTGDNYARIGAAGAGLTALGDARIAHLDADVSSRSTYAGGAVASVTADVGITQAAADKVWGSGARTLTSFGTLVADIWANATRTLTAISDSAGITTLLTRITGLLPVAADYSTARAAKLDNLDAAVSTRGTSTYAGADTPGTTTLLSRVTAAVPLASDYTPTRAGKLDNLDTAISSRGTGDATIANQTTINTNVLTRLAASGYTAPANPTDYARNNAAPSWWTAPDNADIVTALADLVTLLARTDPTTALAAVKVVTDKIASMISGTPSVFTTAALVNAPSGGGGSGSANAYTIFIGSQPGNKMSLVFRAGETGIQIVETLRYSDGNPVDLTGKTITLELLPAAGGSALWSHAAEIEYALGGVASYILVDPDLASAGSYYRRWLIVDGDGNQFTYPQAGNLPVLIQA